MKKLAGRLGNWKPEETGRRWCAQQVITFRKEMLCLNMPVGIADRLEPLPPIPDVHKGSEQASNHQREPAWVLHTCSAELVVQAQHVFRNTALAVHAVSLQTSR